MAHLFRLFLCRRGSTTLEYGLVAILLATAVIGTLSTFGSELQNSLGDLHWGSSTE